MKWKITDIRTYNNRWEVDVLFTKRKLFRKPVETKVTFFQQRYDRLYPDRFYWESINGNSLTSISYSSGVDGHELTMAVFNKMSKDRYKTLVEETNDKVQ